MKNEAGLILTGIRILIKPPVLKEETGKIFIPEQIREREERAMTTGILVDMSEDAKAVKEMKGIEVGDTVFHARYAGDNVQFFKKGVRYMVLNATDVIGKVEEEFDAKFQSARSPDELGQVAKAV